jgi:hypothetical protein
MSVNKLTITSLNVNDTIKQLKLLFGRDIEEKNVSDKNLKKRGIKWFNFFDIDMHIVPVKSSNRPEFKRLYEAQLQIDRNSSDYGILSHLGVSVSDLTPYVSIMRKYGMFYEIILRADGTYQLYIFLDGVIPSYILELDSKRFTLIDEEIKTFA